MLWLAIRLPHLAHEALTTPATALARLAAWAYQYSSLISYRTDDGTPADAADCTAYPSAPLLLLELGASTTLLGEPQTLLAQIETTLTTLRYSHTCALAPTPAAAALLARAVQFGLLPATQRCLFAAAQLRARLAALPLTVLPWPQWQVSALQSAGLTRIGQLLQLPPAALARRFGPEACLYLRRLSGQIREPLPIWRPPERYRACCEFTAAVHDTTALLFPLQRLLQEFQGYLRGRDCAVLRFQLELEHPRRTASRLTLRLSTPAREATALLLLLRERLHSLTLPAPISGMVLTAEEFTAPSILQTDLFDTDAQQLAQLPLLLDRLRARLGDESVQELRCCDEHRPERAWQLKTPAASNAASNAAPTSAPPPPNPCASPRPCWLLEPPQRIDARFELLSGPERIESGWWDGADAVRDYYIARRADGARCWVFRERSRDEWYLQGLWA